MQTEILPAENPESLARAAQVILEGGLVSFPTDTVYGVGVLVDNQAGIEELYRVKERQGERAIPVLLGRIKDLAKITAEIGEIADRLAEVFWPGPLTLVVPRHTLLPNKISPSDTVGVRMPDHPMALALLNLTGPLAVTSANISGASNSKTAHEVYTQLGTRIPLILDGGRTPGGAPSTVVDCTGTEPRILRPGPIPLNDLLSALV